MSAVPTAPSTLTAPQRIEARPTIAADREIRDLLSSLVPGCDECEQHEVDALLARAAWSRLTEPGDGTAATLVRALGPVQALELLASGGSPGSLVSRQEFRAAVKRWKPRLDRAGTIADLSAARASGMRLLVPEDASWPTRLGDLGEHEPLALWVRGSVEALSESSLAVVGARACTGYGSQITAELTGEACAAGFTIVSGAAYGVDAVAHRTALAAGAPTIAVLAGGADRPYPAAHDQLIGRIAAEGTVCSELVPGSAPTRWRFLQRNRLIAAFSQAILVTEAGVRSGTLNTAGHGAELGRPVGAVPGPITSAASAGCHRLVREYGATLVTNGAELFELLGVSELDMLAPGFDPVGASADGPQRPPSLHVRILDALPLTGGRSLGDAARQAGVTPADAAGALAELELLGYVKHRDVPSGETLWTLHRRE